MSGRPACSPASLRSSSRSVIRQPADLPLPTFPPQAQRRNHAGPDRHADQGNIRTHRRRGSRTAAGDWNNTEAILKNFPGFTVFPGSEGVPAAGPTRTGGAGCITATGNVNPAGIRKVYDNWQGPDADALQARINEVAYDHSGLSDGSRTEADDGPFPQGRGLGHGASRR